MKRLQLSAAVLVALLATGQAIAADNTTATPRDPMKAEMHNGMRSADAIGAPFGGERLNQVDTRQTPAQAQGYMQGTSREQVRTEAINAARNQRIAPFGHAA